MLKKKKGGAVASPACISPQEVSTRPAWDLGLFWLQKVLHGRTPQPPLPGWLVTRPCVKCLSHASPVTLPLATVSNYFLKVSRKLPMTLEQTCSFLCVIMASLHNAATLVNELYGDPLFTAKICFSLIEFKLLKGRTLFFF